MQDVEFVVPKENWHSGRVMSKTNIDCLTIIKNFLTEKQQEMFKTCCLGHLLDIDCSFKLVGQVVHTILLHEINSRNVNEMVFDFNGTYCKFSIIQFESIMGLRCCPIPLDCDITNSKNRLKETYFPKKTNVSRRDLKDFLITHQKIGNDEDTVKLTKVFTVENILMSKREIILIDDFVFKLVDDEDKFEDYPWGRLCYKETIKYFRQSFKK